MKKILTVVTVLLVGFLVAEVALAADEARTTSPTRPPKNLKKVGDHWTAWDPPAAGPDDYLIQKGDTLWDLSAQWLQNPFLWPQIWEKNRYILDSHWIYPGDPLVRPGRPEVVPPEGPPEGEEAAQAEPPAAEPAVTGPSRGPALAPVADRSDLDCSGFVDPAHVPADARIVGRELEREHVAQGDVVYLNVGQDQGIQAGARLAVLRETDSVSHPITKQALGTYVRRLGRVRVLVAQQNTAIAVIERACEDILESDELEPWADIPSPMMTSIPKLDRYDVSPTGGAQGYVVTTRDRVSSVGSGHVIHLDLGAGAGVAPGTIVNLFRDNADLPRLMLGRAIVLTVEPGTSTAKIVQSFREIERGDRVEVVR